MGHKPADVEPVINNEKLSRLAEPVQRVPSSYRN